MIACLPLYSVFSITDSDRPVSVQPCVSRQPPTPASQVSFPIVGDPLGASLVAWTTTPWTLPSNLALCVHPTMMYVKVRRKLAGPGGTSWVPRSVRECNSRTGSFQIPDKHWQPPCCRSRRLQDRRWRLVDRAIPGLFLWCGLVRWCLCTRRHASLEHVTCCLSGALASPHTRHSSGVITDPCTTVHCFLVAAVAPHGLSMPTQRDHPCQPRKPFPASASLFLQECPLPIHSAPSTV